ncbi:MAG: C-GCAxxG-C-C family protein, partial [Candidatus Bathyarchaeota archaeon]|nr:C-GCAxxG-C-C family protein [Candidatus Bathyarchaeota archaeon]
MVDENLVKNIRRNAEENCKFYGCSQIVLLALQEGLGIGDHESFKAATMLSGGVARRGETCGSILGALMALSLVKSRERIEDTDSFVNASAIGTELCEEFQRKLEEEFHFEAPLESSLCKEIQRNIFGRWYDVRIPEEKEAFLKAGGLGQDGCMRVIGVA